MADTDYSSLREAVNRIMGAPAGGAQGAAQDVAQLAPRAPYSQDLATVAPGSQTGSTISNTYFDPNAEANAANAASLAALTAQNNQLAGQTAPASANLPAGTEAQIRTAMARAGAGQQAIDQTVASHLAAYTGKPSTYLAAPVASTAGIKPAFSYSASSKHIDPQGKMNDAYWMSGGQQRVQGQMGPPKSSAPWQEAQAYWKALANAKQ